LFSTSSIMICASPGPTANPSASPSGGMTVADFYVRFMERLRRLGIDVADLDHAVRNRELRPVWRT
jgi:hypothetical protein